LIALCLFLVYGFITHKKHVTNDKIYVLLKGIKIWFVERLFYSYQKRVKIIQNRKRWKRELDGYKERESERESERGGEGE